MLKGCFAGSKAYPIGVGIQSGFALKGFLFIKKKKVLKMNRLSFFVVIVFAL